MFERRWSVSFEYNGHHKKKEEKKERFYDLISEKLIIDAWNGDVHPIKF